MASIRKDLPGLKELSYVKEVELEDSCLNLTIEGPDGNDASGMFILADEYPRGESTLLTDGEMIPEGDLCHIARWFYKYSFKVPAPCGADGEESTPTGTPLTRDFSGDPSMDFGYGEDDDGDFVEDMSSEFSKDMEAYRKRFGPDSVELHDFPKIDSAVAVLQMRLEFLDTLTLSAWGMDPELPILVAVTVSRSSYTAHPKKLKVECSQAGRNCTLAGQFEIIANRFMKQVHEGGAKPGQSPGCLGDNDAAMNRKEEQAKTIPYHNDGFLVQLVDYLRQRSHTCSDYCVLCDRTHLFTSGGMLKPSVCSRDLCAFAFQELKVGAAAAEEIATEAGVIDLLVVMCQAAAASQRADEILSPFPQVVDPKNTSKLALNPEQRDTEKVRSIFKKFPPVQKLASAESVADLRKDLEEREPLAYPLLQWIINSNRSHILKLKPNHLLERMNTQHQYLLVTAPPERQAKFNELKRQHGSEFAFHGSPMENWHRILREGLRNASGSKLQLHGAAHGSGIYLAPKAQSSLGYAQRGMMNDNKAKSSKTDLDKKFIDTSCVICLALCEIIKGKRKDHGWCWTVAEEEAVMTRFFFVYEQTNAESKVDTVEESFIKEINTALRHYGVTD